MKLEILVSTALLFIISTEIKSFAGTVTSDPEDNIGNIGIGNILVAQDDTVTFTAASDNDDGTVTIDQTMSTFGNGFSNNYLPDGGDASIDVAFSEQGENDCTICVNHSDPNNVVCATDSPAHFKVYVPIVSYEGDTSSSAPSGPTTDSYIDNASIVDTTTYTIKISTNVVINTGLNGISISNLATPYNRNSSDLYNPTSGTTSTDPIDGTGVFKSLFTTKDVTDPLDVSFNFSPSNEQMETYDEHQMLPATYDQTFTITAYTTAKESDPTYTGPTSTTYNSYVAGTNQYYYITSSVSAKEDFLLDVAIEGFGYAPSFGGTLLKATPSSPLSPPTPLPAGCNAGTKFYNITIAATSGYPLGNNNNQLYDGVSCAIVRNSDSQKSGVVIPSTLSNVAGVSVNNYGSRNCDDKVTSSLGNYHIDLYFASYTRGEVSSFGQKQEVVNLTSE